MQTVLESFGTLKKRFKEDESEVKIIERELELANEWIAKTTPPESTISPRTLGSTEPSQQKQGTRSIFDDIDC